MLIAWTSCSLYISSCSGEVWVQEREQRLEGQLRSATKETMQVRHEMQRLEVVNNNLQGYGLDNLQDDDLTNLIASLTQVSI